MGSSSGGKKRYASLRNKQRANMSFFIVVMFFAVFGIIVFTEIFLIDERGRGAGVLVRHGSLGYNHRSSDRDYEEALQVHNLINLNNYKALSMKYVHQINKPCPIQIVGQNAHDNVKLNFLKILFRCFLNN